jgi:uncharacterized protein (DUF1015 family)
VPEVRPFAAVRYRVADAELGAVLAPPYDVITPAFQDELYSRDPRNVVRVVLNRAAGDAGYGEAGETYRRWRAQGLLEPDPVPGFYILEQSFTVGDRRRVRRGLIARFRAEDPSSRAVLPHEQTRREPREDRYRVLLATRANFSPIFMMFPDAGGRFESLAAEVAAGPCLAAYTDEGGVGHRLWRLDDAETGALLSGLLGGVTAYIADGHHRYATALRHRDATGPEGAWTLGYFTPMAGDGLCVLPYHRLLAEGPALAEAHAALEAHGFRVHAAAGTMEAARVAAASTAEYAFALVAPGAGALVAESGPGARGLLPSSAPASLAALDTFFFHEAVLARVLGVPASAVRYVHSIGEAAEAVEAGRCRLAALLRATPVAQIVAVAEAGESMPAKSTFFHPKLPSGLVIHELPGPRA